MKSVVIKSLNLKRARNLLLRLLIRSVIFKQLGTKRQKVKTSLKAC